MEKGFLLKNDSRRVNASFGPLHDERSLARVRVDGWDTTYTSHGWGQRCDNKQLEGDANIDNPHVVDTKFSTSIRDIDETTTGSKAYTNDTKNEYSGTSTMPFLTYAVPMNALGCYYTQYYYATHIKMKNYYFSWNDKNPKTHLLRWTSIYICPMNGEIFVCGRWPNNEDVVFEETNEVLFSHNSNIQPTAMNEFEATANNDIDEFAPFAIDLTPTETFQIRWMKTKKAAEHGAAAWAYDCFQHRHSLHEASCRTVVTDPTPTPRNEVIVTGCIGCEVPYLYDNAIRSIPSYVPEEIQIEVERCQADVRNDTLKYGEFRKNAMEYEEELAWCERRQKTDQ